MSPDRNPRLGDRNGATARRGQQAAPARGDHRISARAWLAVALLGLVGVLMLGVFPARTLAAQRAERREVAARITDLTARNQSLQAQADLLNSPAEIERLARQHYDLVRPGEEVFAIVSPQSPTPPPLTTAPPPEPGWARRLMIRVLNVF